MTKIFQRPDFVFACVALASLATLSACGGATGTDEAVGAAAEATVVARTPGDVDGDRRADIVLAGGNGWTKTPIAHAQPSGSFSFTNVAMSSLFTQRASQSGVKKLSGDFNGDSQGDLILIGGGLSTIPVAYSSTSPGGIGAFFVRDQPSALFQGWASQPGVQAVTGDFDADGLSDIALFGGGFTTIPVAYATAGSTGNFDVMNGNSPLFQSWVSYYGGRLVPGDFNRDGHDDVALIGAPGLTSIPIALAYDRGSQYSNSGAWGITNALNDANAQTFQGWAAMPGAVPLAGDFNCDGLPDIALVGSTSFTTIPVALSKFPSFAVFDLANGALSDFTTFATWPGATPVAGDFNNDGCTDIALVGSPQFTTVPIAMGTHNGTFYSENWTVPSFTRLATAPGAVALSGPKSQ